MCLMQEYVAHWIHLIKRRPRVGIRLQFHAKAPDSCWEISNQDIYWKSWRPWIWEAFPDRDRYFNLLVPILFIFRLCMNSSQNWREVNTYHYNLDSTIHCMYPQFHMHVRHWRSILLQSLQQLLLWCVERGCWLTMITFIFRRSNDTVTHHFSSWIYYWEFQNSSVKWINYH